MVIMMRRDMRETLAPKTSLDHYDSIWFRLDSNDHFKNTTDKDQSGKKQSLASLSSSVSRQGTASQSTHSKPQEITVLPTRCHD